MAGTCCGGNGCASFFGTRMARRDLRSYLRKGLRGDAAVLAGWAEEGGLEGATVLEVGGGVGQVQAELLRRGAGSGTVVDVVPAYEPFAADLRREAGIEDRSRFLVADVTEAPEAVGVADVVVLRRVVCCSPYGPQLLGAAARLAGRTVVASYPRDRRGIRAVVAVQNAVLRLLGKEFRVFVHAPALLEAAAVSEGLRRVRLHRGRVWECAAFERDAA